MPESFRALIVVLVLAIPAFVLTRRIAGSAVTHHEFTIWRNAWFAVTVAAFLSGNFFLFAAVAAIVCVYARAARGAAIGLFFILLLAVPSARTVVSAFGAIDNLIELNNARLLAIFLMLPVLFGAVGRSHRSKNSSAIPDRLIVGYVLLSIVLAFRQANITSVMRGATQFTLDILVPYFTFSRAVTTLVHFRKAVIAFVVGLLPLSLIAVLETVKGWPLYYTISQSWQASVSIAAREGMLRGGASAGPIPFGFASVVAIGCMLAIRRTNILANRFVVIGLVVIGGGLIATLSRGPWVGAAVLIIVFLVTGPKAIAKLALYATTGALALVFLSQIPAAQRLMEFLPFLGTVDEGNVNYRQRLFEASILVIERNFLFGSVDYLSAPEMQSLLQGQQIIDIVNSYLGIALDIGVVGLALFMSFFLSVIFGLWGVLRLQNLRDTEFIVYGRVLIAILISMLVMIATVSSVEFIPYIYWSFAGLCVAFTRIAYREHLALFREGRAKAEL